MPSHARAGPPQLPADANALLKLAAQSMFDTLASTAMGMMVVDREHRIVWISEGYKQFLPSLGHAEENFVGRRARGAAGEWAHADRPGRHLRHPDHRARHAQHGRVRDRSRHGQRA
jgi:hypothetical protein